jgi:hypothetical protein
VYILKQEKPIDSGNLTSAQATRMMALPLTELREIMKHFELCDIRGEPICWNLIAEIVTPEGETPEPEDEDDDDDDEEDDCAANTCIHGYGYCVECGVDNDGDNNSSGSSDTNKSGDDGGSVGSGFSLKASTDDDGSQGSHSSISITDHHDDDSDDEDDGSSDTGSGGSPDTVPDAGEIKFKLQIR